MFTVPADLAHTAPASDVIRAAAGCLVAYRARASSREVAVLFTQPTLVCVRAGTKILRPADGSEPLIVRSGRVVLVPAGMRSMSELLAEDGAYRSTVISLDASFIARTLPYINHAVGADSRPAPVIDPVSELVELLAALPAQGGGAAAARLLELKIEEIVLRLGQGSRACQAVLAHGVRIGHGEGPARLQAVMRQHLHEPLQLGDFAALCGRSLASFKRDFRKIYGVSPGAWLIEQRLALATQLLVDRGLNVSETCRASGFGNLSHFIRSFRKAYGMPPKQWQLRHRQGGQAPPGQAGSAGLTRRTSARPPQRGPGR